jgi:hypothetical protein
MTPYELAKLMHRELSPIAPRLSAALNRALVDIGEGSMLVGLGPGTHADDDVSFQESEAFDVPDPGAGHRILAEINTALGKLENNTAWQVLVDKKPSSNPKKMELLYTIFRIKNTL